jgi:hypothetical protein
MATSRLSLGVGRAVDCAHTAFAELAGGHVVGGEDCGLAVPGPGTVSPSERSEFTGGRPWHRG